mgnify:CR=1 FL=1
MQIASPAAAKFSSCKCQQGIDCLLKAIHLVQLLHQPTVDEGHAFEDNLLLV